MSVPIATSAPRSGFGPQLALRYDSGTGNGPFGFGWSLGLPSITRRTDQGLPRYWDAEESDVFILSGSEDLVPVPSPSDAVDPAGYQVRRYRPRIEGLFARIERWTAIGTGEIHWRSISRENVTTLYGIDNMSRIFDPGDRDPAHPTCIFSWLISQSYDDKGNAIVYDYRGEDSAGVDDSQAHERNRDATSRSAQRYLKAIKYGNRVSRLANPDLTTAEWLFEVVFDYGEGHLALDPVDAEGRQTVRADRDGTGIWPVRPDPFSTYRATFDLRTYRLCERVLVFHHFPDELGRDDTLVRSTDFTYDRSPNGSFLTTVTQCGYVAWPDATGSADLFLRRTVPPLGLDYSKAAFSDDVGELDRESLENLPGGMDALRHQWIDLDGEGLSGFLTEQGDALYYKRNLGGGRFGAIERLARIPGAHRLAAGGQQLLDLAGAGALDLVDLSGTTPGYYARTVEEDWEPFATFKSVPCLDWTSPYLRFVDLTGDGRADVLITEDCAFRWHPSLGKAGFGPEERTSPPLDEERGPRLVFADGTESIYLADLSGDGLTDLVRIRNGEVSYWPNLGYGRFGARVTMDASPRFDAPDLFNQRQIRLADVDGSGTVDIIYLQRGCATLYRNLSGNAWSAGEVIEAFPIVDDLSTVTVTDLFGSGTACLVWSSSLPSDARRPIRFLDLMAQGKPHLLVTARNNLGATTRVEYAPATKFYLADRAAGHRPITKLPFPLHVVERVTVEDQWRGTSFSSTYSYHHGYFDGFEREFRGFARVEQVDVESFGHFVAANAGSPYVTSDQTLYQPPIKTITWCHTGVALGRERLLTQLADEYFPSSLSDLPGSSALDAVFAEKVLPEPDLGPETLTPEEWREALRACKGMTLRQEVYELDVQQLETTGAHVPVRLFSAATHNCNIRLLQPRGNNRHAVFLVTESEALTYHYELDLRPSLAGMALAPDPRVAHTLNLSFDDLGNVIQSVAVGYPRAREHQDAALDPGQIGLVRAVQNELQVAYTETTYTNDVPANPGPAAPPPGDYRVRVPYEVKTFELTGFTPARGRYFELAELRDYQLNDVAIPGQGTGAVVSRPYHDLMRGPPTKRLVEHARSLFMKDDLTGWLPLGTLGRLGLTYERYKLALTDPLLNAIFTAARMDDPMPAGGGSARAALAVARTSGYLGGTDATDKFGAQATGQYWMRSGIAGFKADAAEHFYLPSHYTDPFQRVTELAYDTKYDHFIQSATDARGNRTSVVDFDYRVLAARQLEDANGNRTEIRFDGLGRVIALALRGKGAEADDLAGYDEAFANPGLAKTLTFFDLPQLTESQARTRFAPILGNATTRFLYDFGETTGAAGSAVWLARPAGACAIMRERHAATIAAGDPASPLQIAFECSDGGGGVLLKRVQAEPEQPGGAVRWIVSGKTVVNNKGKPVKQYEPYFSTAANCRGEGDVREEVGVTPVLYYDAAGRLVRTEMPDGTYSRVELSPWHATSYDAGDTAYDPNAGAHSDWYDRRTNPAHPRHLEFSGPDDARAAAAAQMYANTPARTIVDSLGRDVVRIEHNRYADSPGVIRDERFLTFTRLDAEGKPLWIRDARGNLVMQYVTPARPNNDPGDALPGDGSLVPCYDIAGNLLYQHGMDAGDRWTLMDAAGQAMLAWDFNTRTLDNGNSMAEDRRFQTRYDDLHRPIDTWLAINTAAATQVEAFSYIDAKTFVSLAGVVDQPALDAARALNLIGQATQHYDPSGLATVERVDFKGAAEEITRTLVDDVEAAVVDWNVANRATLLEDDTFIQITEHDALGRMTTLYNWHRDVAGQSGTSTQVAVYVPAYDARGALQSEMLHVRATKEPGPGGRPSFQKDPDPRRNVKAIGGVTRNAKGQKTALALGNGTTTRYDYDPESFRLRHLYTRRAVGFAGDCAGDPDAARPARPCGVQNLHYTYDPSGNVTHVQDDAQDTVWFANQQVEPSSDFTYDALYRLIEATGRENDAAVGAPPHAEGQWPTGHFPTGAATRNYRQLYRYDSVGNFLSVQHIAPPLPGRPDGRWTREYDYAFSDTANQPASNRLWQTWVGGDRTQAVTYRRRRSWRRRGARRAGPALGDRVEGIVAAPHRAAAPYARSSSAASGCLAGLASRSFHSRTGRRTSQRRSRHHATGR
jgi:hypothetical protein